MTPETLKTQREAAGLTVAQAAESVGVSRATWYRWEQGTSRINPMLARAMTLTPTDIDSGSGGFGKWLLGGN